MKDYENRGSGVRTTRLRKEMTTCLEAQVDPRTSVISLGHSVTWSHDLFGCFTRAMKGTLCCVIRGNFKWNCAVRPYCGIGLWKTQKGHRKS